MTIEELRKLIAAGEGRMVEVKETTGQRVEACRTLCAFLNGNGGMVVFGVTKSGKLTGQLVSDETKQNLARAFLDLEPGTEIGVEYVDIDATHKATFARPSPTIQKNPTIQKAPTIQKNPTAVERKKGRGKAFEGVTTEAVIDVIRAKNSLSMKEMAHILGMSEVGIKYQMTLLSRRGRIRRVGGRKNGHWEETGYASPQFSESVDSRKTKVGGEAAEKQSGKRGRQTEMRGDASGGPARRTIKRTIKRSTKQLTNARVLDVIVRNPGVARPQIAIMIGRGLSATAKALSELQQSGKIEHRGSKKTGGYYAKETP